MTYKDIKSIESTFAQHLPEVQIADIQQGNARTFDIYTPERLAFQKNKGLFQDVRGNYTAYCGDGYILNRDTNEKIQIS